MSFLTVKPFAVITLCCAITCGCNAQNTTSSDQEIPPAVAKQLEAMQKRIDDLERELSNRPQVQTRGDGLGGTTTAHILAEPGSGESSSGNLGGFAAPAEQP